MLAGAEGWEREARGEGLRIHRRHLQPGGEAAPQCSVPALGATLRIGCQVTENGKVHLQPTLSFGSGGFSLGRRC